MIDDLEDIKEDIRAEFEVTEHVEAWYWLDEYPEHREELEAFILELTGTLELSPVSEPDRDHNDAVIREAVALTMKRLSEQYAERDLAEARSRIARGSQSQVSAKVARPRIYAFVIGEAAATTGTIIDRVKAVKLTHFLQEFFGLELFHFVPASKGPLDTEIYRDEGVAKKEKWLTPVGEYEMEPGPDIGRAIQDVGSFLPAADLARELIQLLARHDQWELAVWSTVLWTARKLQARGQAITVDNVKLGITEEEAWKTGKLDWDEFSDENIEDALDHLGRLGLLPAEDIGPG